MDVIEIKRLLIENGLTPNRALGQNFLCDNAAAATIAAALCATPAQVVEIGPGLGALTDVLLQSGHTVTAVEIDAAMVAALRARKANEARLTLIHADFLKTELSQLAPGPFYVAGNLPYYVTTPICTKLLCSDLSIPGMVLMLQKEAAQRFFAAPGERVYGPLAVMAQWLYGVEQLLELSPASYYPQPDVYSTVLRLTRNDRPFLPRLPALVNAAFAMRRKTLQNNLKPLGIGAAVIAESGIDPHARAEALPPEAFAMLCQAVYR